MSQTTVCEIPLQEIAIGEPGGLAISLSGQHHYDSHYPNAEGVTARGEDKHEYRFGNIHFDKNTLYLVGACIGGFTVGLNDTATGANLPSMQEQYNLSYSVVSLVFLAGFSGYIVSCMLNPILQNAIGTRLVLMIGGCCYGGGSLLISFAPPFPAVAGGLVLMGLGGGAYEACMSSVISHLDNSKYMNMLYASFGLGSLVSPFIIGSFAKDQVRWNLYYWIPFSLVLVTMTCHFFLFKHYVLPSDEGATHRGTARTRFAQTSRRRITWIGVTLTILSFAIFYIVSNWLTTYLLDTKGFEQDTSRYHLSVFFAGKLL
ncbi:major facilitator superfamily transporter [Ceratobasidium sp. AG-Ba]|nr:major facilitator superfamily transporter [Ceratobasidium sp. AG-Ba]